MYRKGKSENALYYVYPISKTKKYQVYSQIRGCGVKVHHKKEPEPIALISSTLISYKWEGDLLMADNRSFTKCVKNTYDNQFWAVAEEYLRENIDLLNMKLFKVHKPGEQVVKVEHVWVEDLPKIKIQFDVALSVIFEIPEADYHYDVSKENRIWLMVRCRGDLSCNLQDFEIFEVCDYTGENRSKNPLDDSLVTYILYEKLDKLYLAVPFS